MPRTRTQSARRPPRGASTAVAVAPPPHRSVWWRAAIVVAAGIVAYANSLSGPFIFDDDASIVENTQIRSLAPSVAFRPYRELPTAGRPIVNASFAVNYAIGGLQPAGYHVGNIAIHILCALALFGIVRRTLDLPGIPAALQRRSADLALAAALLWVVHPLNSEAVDYLTQRTESLMGLFYLLTLYCSIRTAKAVRYFGPEVRTAKAVRYFESAEAVRYFGSALRHFDWWTVAAVASCALGMASKEPMVTAPVVVALYDRIFLFDSFADAFRRRRPLYVGLAATWIVLASMIASGPRMHSAGFSAGVSAWTYLLNQTVMITRYLRLAAWPRSLVLAYGPPRPLAVGDVMAQAIVVLVLIAGAAVMLYRWPRAGFLAAVFFITLAPSSSIVPVATEVGAERRMYLPLAALVVLAVVAIGDKLRPRVAAVVLAMVTALLTWQTALRAREYSSSLRMAETVLERWPGAFAHGLYGVELSIAGRHDEALAHLRQSAPTYSRAHYPLGGELFSAGRTDEALVELQQFVREQPLLLEAVRARTMIGRIYLQQRKYDEAIEQFRMVLTMTAARDDAHVIAVGFLADALFAEEKFAEAIDQYRAFLVSRPNEASAQMNLAIALASTGHADDATQAFRRAVAINPSDPTARQNLASHLFNLGQLDGAAAEAREIVKLNPNSAGAHDLLGRVHGSNGRLAEARAEFERALQIDPHDAQARADLDLLLRALRTPGSRK